MDFSRWKDIAELAGLVAIIASLIFVGLQLKQSQEIALATQYQARAEATMNVALVGVETNYVPPIPMLREGLSDTVSARDINMMHWFWIQMDNHYYQYQHGFLAEDAWQAQRRNIQETYGNCELRFVYEWRKQGIRAEFVAMVESLDDPCAEAE